MRRSSSVEATLNDRPVSEHRSSPRGKDTGPDHWIGAGVAMTLAFCAALASAQLVDFGLRLHSGLLESETHRSFFGILSLLAQAAAAVAAAVPGQRVAHRNVRRVLAGLLFLLLVVRIFIPYDTWLLLPPLVVVVVLCWRLTAEEAPRVRTVTRSGLCLLAFSFVVHAIGVKVVGALGYGPSTWPYEVKAVLKHASELGGWLLLATGLVASAAAGDGSFARRRG